MRSRIAKRLPPDADKLVGLSLALFASGSRIEDRFWEAKLDTLLAKIVRNGNQTTLDVPEGTTVKTIPANLAVFRIQQDGRLEFVRRYDVAVGRKPLWWAGLVALPAAASP